jgi:hypothetical protein
LAEATGASLNISVSFMITEWLGLAFYFIKGNASWRVLFGLQYLPGFMMLAGSFFMPESPRWLVLRDRYDDAQKVLRRMHSNEHDETFYVLEFQQISAQIEYEKSQHFGVLAIFKKKSYFRRVALICTFFFFQQ